MGLLSMLLGATLAGVAVAFAYGWKLTLVVLLVAPVVAVSQFLVCKRRTCPITFGSVALLQVDVYIFQRFLIICHAYHVVELC